MEHFLASTLAVAIAEIGDKTQLLALLLAARFRRPWPIVAGILVATLLNHALAGWLGTLIAAWLTPEALRWTVVASFAAIGLWTLIPDKLDEADARLPARGAFVATCIAFFIAEIGDKTQIATVVLAARAPTLWPVVLGTTLGMLIANVPVVLLGSRLAERLPLKAARLAAALLFLALALWVAVRGLGEHAALPTPAAAESRAADSRAADSRAADAHAAPPRAARHAAHAPQRPAAGVFAERASHRSASAEHAVPVALIGDDRSGGGGPGSGRPAAKGQGGASAPGML